MFVAGLLPGGKPVRVSFTRRFEIAPKPRGQAKAVHQFESKCGRWVTPALQRSFQPSVTFPQMTMQEPKISNGYRQPYGEGGIVGQRPLHRCAEIVVFVLEPI
jgi:hypothetical protein